MLSEAVVVKETRYSDIDLLLIVKRDFSDWRERREVETELSRDTADRDLKPLLEKTLVQGGKKGASYYELV